MKIAHFSDTHLGFRAYGRLDSNGLNQREVDVGKTFRAVLASIEAQKPDLILHTGDFFHVVRPSNHTIVQAFREIATIQARREFAPFAIVAGNHEIPKSSDAGCILRLFGNEDGSGSIPGVHVFIDAPEMRFLAGIQLRAVSSRALAATDNRYMGPNVAGPSVLAMHGLDAALSLPKTDFDILNFDADKWTFVALGDYHIRKELGKNSAYCGSTDFTSSNIWEEIATPKGWYLLDTETGSRKFIEISPTRAAMDLSPIDAQGLSGEEVGTRLQCAVSWVADEMPIVRQRVLNVHPAVRSSIPHAIIREIKSSTLHYRLDISIEGRESAGEMGTRSRSLVEEWSEFAATRSLPAKIDRAEYVGVGTNLIEEVSDVAEEA